MKMKKHIFWISALFLMMITSLPVHAFSMIERTSSNEYYLWLYKDGRETYEGRAVTVRMFEDAGFDTEILYESDWNKKMISSSKEKILNAYGPIITCNKPGDVKVTLYGDKGTKVNKVHVFDLKLYPVTPNSKKITLKARGNLKGCKAIVRIAGKTYKKKITKKNQKISFKIPKMASGRKIRVKLTKGKKQLLTYGSCVY